MDVEEATPVLQSQAEVDAAALPVLPRPVAQRTPSFIRNFVSLRPETRGGEKGRDDLFAETPPLEAKSMLISGTATRRKDGRWRKLVFIDAKKAHLNSEFRLGVYVIDESNLCSFSAVDVDAGRRRHRGSW